MQLLSKYVLEVCCCRMLLLVVDILEETSVATCVTVFGLSYNPFVVVHHLPVMAPLSSVIKWQM